MKEPGCKCIQKPGYVSSNAMAFTAPDSNLLCQKVFRSLVLDSVYNFSTTYIHTHLPRAPDTINLVFLCLHTTLSYRSSCNCSILPVTSNFCASLALRSQHLALDFQSHPTQIVASNSASRPQDPGLSRELTNTSTAHCPPPILRNFCAEYLFLSLTSRLDSLTFCSLVYFETAKLALPASHSPSLHAPRRTTTMSAYNNHQTWTNEMMDAEELPAFSGPLDPYMGFGDAEAG